jgi:hypothetical protein
MRTEAAAYRAFVRASVNRRLNDLAGSWDGLNPAEPASFYFSNAIIALGPSELIEGRKNIQAAFAGKLGRMHGVLFNIDEFDMGEELVFVRGTMRYELIRPNGAPTKETAAFAIIFRERRDEWLIKSHVIGAKPDLAEDPPH